MKKRMIIVANGNLSESLLQEIGNTDTVIGVDRGAYWLLIHGVVPHIAVGDFDSCTTKELAEVKKKVADVRMFDAEKDYTDTELALEVALEKKPQEIVLLGVVGTRMDHTLATISLLERSLRAGIPAVVRDQTNDITLLGRGRTIMKRRAGRTYVSIIPFTKEIVVSLNNLKYPLIRKRITLGMTLGVSNEFTGLEATITVHKGLALVIQSKD